MARVRGDAITRARSADEVPLATAVGLLARERLTGDGVLVVDETLGNRVSAFDIASDGTLGPRRDWARFG